MSNRKMQDGLVHAYSGVGHDKFFALVDETGGWPLGFKYAGFEHTDERKAGFTNSPSNDGWWTVVATSDDYYLWKLSPEAIGRIATSVLQRAAQTVRTTNVKELKISNSRGYEAALSKATP